MNISYHLYFKRLVFKQVLTAFIYGQSVVKLSKNKVKRSLFLFKLIISVFVLILLKAITITLFFWLKIYVDLIRLNILLWDGSRLSKQACQTHIASGTQMIIFLILKNLLNDRTRPSIGPQVTRRSLLCRTWLKCFYYVQEDVKIVFGFWENIFPTFLVLSCVFILSCDRWVIRKWWKVHLSFWNKDSHSRKNYTFNYMYLM